MAAITLTVEGLGALEARLGALLARAADLTPLMDRIGMAMETTTSERFDQGVSPEGAPWKPSLRAKSTGGKTLVDTARLRQSITHRASSARVEIGTNLIYARIHQLGGTIHAKAGGHLKFRLPGGLGFRSVESVRLPPRPFLGVSAEDLSEIAGQVDDYLLEGMGA